MKHRELCRFTPGDHAIQLDLIGQVRGVVPAELYFNSLDQEHKTQKAYGALLNCYVREGLVEESLQHMKKMQELGFASTALPYNNIMCLYANSGQLEKVPLVLAEMKENGVLPDNFSYRLCINSYGSRCRISEMEEALEEMDCQPQIVVDWNTYAVVAHIYIKAGIPDKAAAALKKSEEKMDRKNHLCYGHLISLYGALKKKAEMRRLWELQEQMGLKHQNRDYTTMLGELVRLGELEEAEDLLKRWESSGNMVDFRVPNVVLAGLCKRGHVEKGEAMLGGFVREGKAPLPSSWGILARAFADKGEMAKAHHYMEKALCGYEPDKGWKPSPSLILSVLQWLGDEANNPKDVENFMKLLKPVMPEIGLFGAHMRAGNRADGHLESRKTDGIEL